MTEGLKAEGSHGSLLKAARRIVIKLGTNTVAGSQGELSAERVRPIAESIVSLMREGRQVVLVSSGAVGLGRGWLGLHPSRLADLVTKQACAAVGQSLMMNAYKELFGEWGVKVAQVLLTEEDFTNWNRYTNLRQTMEKLLGFGVLPIVNENDTVSTAELESTSASGPRTPVFSDNDRLAALVMSGMEAEAVVLMTNVEGLLRNGDKEQGGEQEVISLVSQITPELKRLAAGPSENGRGGMRTKLEAAGWLAELTQGRVAIPESRQPAQKLKEIASDRIALIRLVQLMVSKGILTEAEGSSVFNDPFI